MRLKGLTTAIDYAYLNVLDITDIEYSMHPLKHRNSCQIVGVHDLRERKSNNI
jgi:hypothetical protein